MTMSKLTRAQVHAATKRSEQASAAHLDGDRGAFDRWLDAEGYQPARLEFPLGELLNPAIRGYAAAWHLQGKVTTAGITKGDGFAAQGLEGKAVVEVDLVTALLVARDLPTHRCNVYTAAPSRPS